MGYLNNASSGMRLRDDKWITRASVSLNTGRNEKKLVQCSAQLSVIALLLTLFLYGFRGSPLGLWRCLERLQQIFPCRFFAQVRKVTHGTRLRQSPLARQSKDLIRNGISRCCLCIFPKDDEGALWDKPDSLYPGMLHCFCELNAYGKFQYFEAVYLRKIL